MTASDRKRRERRIPPGIIPTILLALAIVAWVVIPFPFVRGIIIGWVTALGLLLGGGILIARKMRGQMSGSLAAPPLPVGKWDFELIANRLDGTPTDFSSFAGKVLVLNVWATSCAPCIAEMPSLARLRDATMDVDVTLACVTREPGHLVRTFVDRQQLKAPIYILEGSLPACFATAAIPATFVLDKRGTIALRHIGAAAWDDPGVVSFVRGLALAPKM